MKKKRQTNTTANQRTLLEYHAMSEKCKARQQEQVQAQREQPTLEEMAVYR